jgi:hypothetical protein
MTRDDIIASLVAELAPVRRLRSADTRASMWAGLATVCIGLGCYCLGTRADLPRKLLDVNYFAESAALLAMAALAARDVFHVSVPGAARSPGLRIAPAIAGLIWIMLLVLRWLAGPREIASSWTAGLPCVARIAGLALVPAVAIVAMLRRAAPAMQRRTGLLSFVAAAALGVAGTQLICAKDESPHVLLWHAGPLALAALIGFAVGRSLLAPASNWRRSSECH